MSQDIVGRTYKNITNTHKRNTPEIFFISVLIFLSSATIFAFLDNSILIIPVASIVYLIYISSAVRPQWFNTVTNFCFNYRWAIAILLFLLCTSLKLSGSSIGVFNSFLPTKITEQKSTLFGVARAIRSDEWAVQIPTFFSQKHNNYMLYSNQMSLSATNMVMDFYAPVWDITIIGKPLSWGYLLFGNSIGLSWYWCGQLMLLFMLSLEMFLIITESNRKVSVVGSIMITLSPAIQWWFMPQMPIVIMYAEAIFVIAYHFFTAGTDKCRVWLAIASVIAVVGFALSFFPSFQVPCLYIVISITIASLYRDRSHLSFTKDKWYFIVLPAFFACLIFIHFYKTSYDAIDAVLNSVYPGKRISIGGDKNISALFTNLSSLILPYKDITYLNNCEVSDYIHFAPFFIALTPRILTRLRKSNESLAIGVILSISVVFTGAFMVIGIPQWLSNITLLRFCNRMNGIYGWCSTIFTVWGFGIIIKYPNLLKKWQKILYPLLYAVTCIVIADNNVTQYFNAIIGVRYSGTVIMSLISVVLSTVLLFALFSEKKLFCALISAVMVLCGATVNPIEKGTSAFSNHPIYSIIYDLSVSEPNSRWLFCGNSFVMSNYLLACGVKSLDATNFYYDKNKWDIIDSRNTYLEDTNRYSNQSAELTDTDNRVKIIAQNCIHYYLNCDTMKNLEIKYILSEVNYEELFDMQDITYQIIGEQDNYRIYRLEY